MRTTHAAAALLLSTVLGSIPASASSGEHSPKMRKLAAITELPPESF